jgi:hypothetical protein
MVAAYAAAVILYIAASGAAVAYLLLVVVLEGYFDLGLLSGMILSVAPTLLLAYLVIARWRNSRRRGIDFLPAEFRAAKRLGYLFGVAQVWFGHVLLLCTIGLITYFYLTTPPEGVPLGLGLGWALGLYAGGIICVEVSVRRWAKTSSVKLGDA